MCYRNSIYRIIARCLSLSLYIYSCAWKCVNKRKSIFSFYCRRAEHFTARVYIYKRQKESVCVGRSKKRKKKQTTNRKSDFNSTTVALGDGSSDIDYIYIGEREIQLYNTPLFPARRWILWYKNLTLSSLQINIEYNQRNNSTTIVAVRLMKLMMASAARLLLFL